MTQRRSSRQRPEPPSAPRRHARAWLPRGRLGRRAALVAAGAALLAGVGPAEPSPPAGELAAEAVSDPCDRDHLELSAPRGRVLGSRVVLRWLSDEDGPFQVTVLDEAGRSVYTASTFAHELRVLVGAGEGELASGREYSWAVRPQGAEAADCPTAEFRVLTPEESGRAQARFEAAARELGVGDESKDPAAGMALARMYLEEGFQAEAEEQLVRLIDEGWDDPRIDEMLAELYRQQERTLSLRAMPPPPDAGAAPAG